MQKNTVELIGKQGKYYLKGELNLSNVMQVHQESLHKFENASELVFDFSQLNACDSSGLALMVEWIRFAKQHKKSIKLLNLSQEVMSIASIAGLDKLLARYQ